MEILLAILIALGGALFGGGIALYFVGKAIVKVFMR